MTREELRTELVDKITNILRRWNRWMSEDDIKLLEAQRSVYQEDDGTVLDKILAKVNT